MTRRKTSNMADRKTPIRMTAGYHVNALMWNLERPADERDPRMEAEARGLMLYALHTLNGSMAIPGVDGESFCIGEPHTEQEEV